MQTALFDEGPRLRRVWGVFRFVGYKVAVPTWQTNLRLQSSGSMNEAVRRGVAAVVKDHGMAERIGTGLP